MTEPLRRALKSSSPLRTRVRPGLGAMESRHRALIAAPVRDHFAESLALDEALRPGHERENRWDYLLGHAPSNRIVGLEPHSATTAEVSTVIKKREAAIQQLGGHLASGVRVAAWFWVASGRVDFVPHDRQLMRLQQAGVQFVGSTLQQKHLKELRVPGTAGRARPRRRR